MPDSTLDVPGVTLLGAGCFALVWAMVRSADRGLGRPGGGRDDRRRRGAARLLRRLGAPGAAAADPRRAARASAASAPATSRRFLTLASLFSAVFFYGQLLQFGFGDSALEAGLRLMAWTGTFIVVAPIAGTLADRIGERPLLATGLAIQAGAMLWFALDGHGRRRLPRRAGAVRGRRHRRLDGRPVRPERRRRLGRRPRRRHGVRGQRHDARAGRRLRCRPDRRGLRCVRRLRVRRRSSSTGSSRRWSRPRRSRPPVRWPGLALPRPASASSYRRPWRWRHEPDRGALPGPPGVRGGERAADPRGVRGAGGGAARRASRTSRRCCPTG